MDQFTDWVMMILGALFVCLAVLKDTKIRGAFSRGPGLPISRVGRIAFFLIGLLAAADGVRGLLHKPHLELDIVHWRLIR